MDTESVKPIIQAVQSFKDKTLLVIGDIVLDEFMYTDTDRISREAPVFICKFDHSDFYPGCAGNTINNVRSLGAHPIPAGILGDDDDGKTVLSQFRHQEIDCSLLKKDPSVITMKKTRILAGGIHRAKQHMLRVDKEYDFRGKLSEGWILPGINKVDGIIISDYNYNTIPPESARVIIDRAKENDIPVFLDSRYRSSQYTGITAITPNEEEAENILKCKIPESGDELNNAMNKLANLCHCNYVLLTRGSNGLAVYSRDDDRTETLNVYGSREAVDVSGAGDSVMAAFALSMVSGLNPYEAAFVANISGGISVMQKGTYPVKQAEILEAIHGENL